MAVGYDWSERLDVDKIWRDKCIDTRDLYKFNFSLSAITLSERADEKLGAGRYDENPRRHISFSVTRRQERQVLGSTVTKPHTEVNGRLPNPSYWPIILLPQPLNKVQCSHHVTRACNSAALTHGSSKRSNRPSSRYLFSLIMIDSSSGP